MALLVRIDPLAVAGSFLTAVGCAVVACPLAMATRLSWLGRAVALCVTVYVALSVGWPVAIGVVFGENPLGPAFAFAMGSPVIGAMAGTIMIAPGIPEGWVEGYPIAATFWIVIDLATAMGLFAAAASAFDRCLGRMPEGGSSRSGFSA